MDIVKLRPTMCLILSVNPLATAFFDEMRQIVAKLDQFIYFWFSVDCFLRSIHYFGGSGHRTFYGHWPVLLFLIGFVSIRISVILLGLPNKI